MKFRKTENVTFLEKYFPTMKQDDVTAVMCPFCGETTPANGFDNHCMAVHQPTFHCPYCQQVFTTYVLAKNHTKAMHNTDLNKEKVYKCIHCYKSFGFLYLLEMHFKAQHQNQRNFACDLCGERFRRKTNLKKHKINRHLNLKLIKCKLCGMEFKLGGSCRKHLKSVHNITVTGRMNNPETGPNMPMVRIPFDDSLLEQGASEVANNAQ